MTSWKGAHVWNVLVLVGALVSLVSFVALGAAPTPTDACSGRDCQVWSLRAPRSVATMTTACDSAADVGRLLYEQRRVQSDGGVTGRGSWVSCQSDGGWAELGAAAAGGGAAVDWERSPPYLKADAGVELWLPNSPATYPFHVRNNGTSTAAISTQGNGLHLRSAAGTVTVGDMMGTTAARTLETGRFRATVAGGSNGFSCAITGCRIALDSAGSSVYAFGRTSPDVAMVVASGLQIGTTNSARVSSWPRATIDWAAAGGVTSIGAQTCEQRIVTVTGAVAGADCIATMTPLRPGLFLTCSVEDASSANVHVCNVTSGGLSVNTGADVSVRVMNP